MNAPATKPERPISEPVGRHILTSDQLDDLGEAILALTREVYVLTDRLFVLEHVLERKGVTLAGEVERFEMTSDLQTALNAKRDAIINAVLGALKVKP